MLGLMGAARAQDLVLMVIPISYLFMFQPLSPREGKSSNSRVAAMLCGFIVFWGLTIFTSLLFHLPFLLNENNSTYLNQFSRFWHMGFSSNILGLVCSPLWYSMQNIFFGVSPVGGLICILGFLRLVLQKQRHFVFLFLWFIVPLLFYGNLATSDPRFLVIATIPLIMAQGYFLSYLTTFKNKIFDFGIIFIFPLMIVLLFSNIYPVLQFRHKHALLPDFGRYVEKITEDNAFIVAGDEGLFIQYYGNRSLFPRPKSQSAYNPKELNSFKSDLDHFLAQDIPLYITSSGLHSYNPNNQFSNKMKHHYQLTYAGEHLSEDWHKGGTRLRTGKEKLFKITQ